MPHLLTSWKGKVSGFPVAPAASESAIGKWGSAAGSIKLGAGNRVGRASKHDPVGIARFRRTEGGNGTSKLTGREQPPVALPLKLN